MSTHASTKINQKEYLKKYLSGDSKEKKKKKKDKKHKIKGVPNATVKIYDDDEVQPNGQQIDEELLLTGEDAPQIVGEYVEERANVDGTGASKWRSITVKEEDADEMKFKSEDKEELWGRKASSVSRKMKDEFSPPRRKIKKERTDVSLSRKVRQMSDTDHSPPRNETSRRRRSRSRSTSRNSLRRKTHERIRSRDRSPARRRRHSSFDQTPPRKRDQSPPRRRQNHSPDQSPPRKRDQSPPRRRQNHSPDQSPPRKRDKSPSRRRQNHSPDRSPTRKRDQSPPRRRQNHSPDQSPPRKRNKSPPRRRQNHSPDQSPPRKRDQSPPRRRQNHSPDQSLPRRRDRSDSDQSPARKRRSSPIDTRIKQEKRSASRSPPRNSKINESPQRRRSRWTKAASKSVSPPPTHKPKLPTSTKTTLDGKKAGLQDAQSLQIETAERRRREENLFAQMSGDISGRDAEVQVRKTGRRGQRARDAAAEDPAEQQRKEAHEERKRELYDRWGKGLKQIEDHRARCAEQQHESAKPLARYSNDEDLDRHLREQERADDPMLEYMRNKNKERKRDAKEPEMPTYQGSYPENRFGIRPGYRWDGVDRSNGYERKWFAVQSEKQARQEEAYKYSVEDM